jgi:hypothetical protein
MSHPGELTMRRFLAEESLEAGVLSHLRECSECGGRLGLLREETKSFEAEVPFERFAVGVEKSVRLQQQQQKPRRVSRVGWLVALAAGLVAVVLATGPREGTTRLKGGEEVDFVVAGANGQRNAAPVEQLVPGERVRIGVSGHRYVTALSIDDRGVVSTVYAEAVAGLGQTWLPDSIEFTGAGREHVVVVLSDGPVASDSIATQLKDRFKTANGDLRQLGTLDVPGVQVHRTFIKP